MLSSLSISSLSLVLNILPCVDLYESKVSFRSQEQDYARKKGKKIFTNPQDAEEYRNSFAKSDIALLAQTEIYLLYLFNRTIFRSIQYSTKVIIGPSNMPNI